MNELLKHVFLVVPSKDGWAVNLGTDTIQVYATRDDARAEALRFAAMALARGERAGFMEPDLADELGAPMRGLWLS